MLAVVGKHHYVHAPKTMVIKRDGSPRFDHLHWHGFGKSVARATGRAYIRSGAAVRRPRVSLTLTELVEGGEQSVYLILDYRLHGRVPPGFRHRGEGLQEEYAWRPCTAGAFALSRAWDGELRTRRWGLGEGTRERHFLGGPKTRLYVSFSAHQHGATGSPGSLRTVR